MGQQEINPYSEYQNQYALVSENQKDDLLIRHKHSQKEFMLRKINVKSEQELQERLKLLNRRKKIKSEHLLQIVDFKPINSNRRCGDVLYISLLIEYPFESLHYETICRHSEADPQAKVLNSKSTPSYFQEHELWSILYSCVLGLETLYMNDMNHESITKSLIFVDKDGVVKIGDPILLGARANYDRVIEEFQNEKRKKNEPQNSNTFGQKTSRFIEITKANQLIDSSLIVSPELISLCKDHQYYYFDKEKSDVFVLGATMVELGLLKDVASVDTKHHTFNADLSKCFAQNGKLYEMYSDSFLSIIQSMVDLDPKKRPSFSQIVERIEQFSMEESTISDKNNSFKKNPASNLPFEPYSLSQKFKIQSNAHQPVNYGSNSFQNNLFQSKYLEPVTVIPSVNLPIGSGQNSSLSPTNQDLKYPQFPSFSIPQSERPFQNKLKEVFTESAVKSIFPRQQLPVEIKYTESPLIVPVSNVRINQNLMNRNYETPFNQLNLTDSNQKKVIGRTIEKESIVQNKFTLFGPNSIDANNLFRKNPELEQKITNNVTERFSFHNFGKIQIPSNSNPASLNTSALPTPRFQNSFSSANQTNLKINDVSKPLFTPTFHNLNFQNYGTTFPSNTTFNPPSFANIGNTYVQQNKSISPNSYQSINSFQRINEGTYDPKKQGFSISDDIKKGETHSMDRNFEPYFNNSSVGYTLPKYRPQSTYSEIVQVNSQGKQKNPRKLSVSSGKNINNISPTKKNQETESILQNEHSGLKITLSRQNMNSTSVINSLNHLGNDKLETNSNTSTVKKEVYVTKKTDGKKYGFYKKQMEEKLEKVEPLSQMVSTEVQLPSQGELPQQDPPFFGKQLKLSYSQNAVTQVEFEPSSHSQFVEETEPNGSLYRGFKLNGQRHGNGVLIYADSGFYQGQFSHDQMEGFGKLYYNEKDLAYEGQFKQNLFHGYGILYNNNPQPLEGRLDFANLANTNGYWVKYDGYFKEDQKSGKCLISFANGEQFEGYCENSTIEGKGKFKTLQGSIVQGLWRNNVLVEIYNDTETDFANQ